MPYMIEITEVPDLNNDGAMDLLDIELLLRSNNNVLTLLDGDGDFRSEECIGFFKEADVVVTNEAVICGLTPEKACNIKEFAA